VQQTRREELIDKAFKIANELTGTCAVNQVSHIYSSYFRCKNSQQRDRIGAKSIAVALLHDVVEDTEYSLDDVEKDFDPRLLLLLMVLQRFRDIHKENSSSLRLRIPEMLLTLSDDLRVILIKLLTVCII